MICDEAGQNKPFFGNGTVEVVVVDDVGAAVTITVILLLESIKLSEKHAKSPGVSKTRLYVVPADRLPLEKTMLSLELKHVMK